MSMAELQVRPWLQGARRREVRRAWIPVAGVLAGAGWGSNQFTPLLLVYHARLGLSTTTLEALFGAYAAGLIPGLLLAGRWSDGNGRRPVGIAAAALSLLASASLIAGAHALNWLFIGRLLAGVSSGAAFGVGTAWLRETSLPPFGEAEPSTVARLSGCASRRWALDLAARLSRELVGHAAVGHLRLNVNDLVHADQIVLEGVEARGAPVLGGALERAVDGANRASTADVLTPPPNVTRREADAIAHAIDVRQA